MRRAEGRSRGLSAPPGGGQSVRGLRAPKRLGIMKTGDVPMSFLYSDSNKRYHTYSYAMRRRFGGKVMRVSLNAGFTCPNIDGTKGRGGCVFCLSLIHI